MDVPEAREVAHEPEQGLVVTARAGEGQRCAEVVALLLERRVGIRVARAEHRGASSSASPAK